MIPYASCMCFGRQPHCWNVQGRSNISMDVKDKVVYITLKEMEDYMEEESPNARISKSDFCLLKVLANDPSKRPMGPFLTPQKRRSKHPITKPILAKIGYVDQYYSGAVKCMLKRSHLWDFNTFSLDIFTGGRSLSILLVHLFHHYDLITTFNLDVCKVWHCFSLIEEGYHSENPYHNSVHAADVSQAMHCFLQETKIGRSMSPLETMVSLIAAVSHDLDHPGVNQPFLIATSNHLAALYKNFSVLENHHWRSAMSCLRESGIFDHMSSKMWNEIEWQVRSLILATDITRQQEFLSRFRRYLDTELLDLDIAEYRHFILQIALKCADLCNPCRKWEISQKWSHSVCQEFYKQGDIERQLNLPVTPMCDRHKTTIPKIQADFLKFVITPLFEIWDRFLSTPLSEQLLFNLKTNHTIWEQKVNQAAEKKKEEEQVAVVALKTETESDEEEDNEGDDQLSKTLNRIDDDTAQWGRRHSMPLSAPKLPSRTTIRRQSLPQSPLDKAEMKSFQLHRSPHISLRTLSANDLIPKSSIASLGTKGAGISLMKKMDIAAEIERRLVYQPTSYPPYVMHSLASVVDSQLVSPEEESAEQLEDKPENGEKKECVNGCGTPDSSINDVSSGEDMFSSNPEQCSNGISSCEAQVTEKLCSENSPPAQSDPLPSQSTWCSIVSKSMSSERSQKSIREFDSSGKRKCNKSDSERLLKRRGSAPIVLKKTSISEMSENKENIECKSPRRWSISGENMKDSYNEASYPPSTSSRFYQNQLIRRHSFAFLEMASPSEISEPTGILNQQNSLNSEVPIREVVIPYKDHKKSFSTKSAQGINRRGSLPIDIPISLMGRVPISSVREAKKTKFSSFEERCSKTQFKTLERYGSLKDNQRAKKVKTLWESKRRGSAGEILCALLGPMGTLATIQTLNTSNIDTVPMTSFRGLPRRGSGNLELISGFLKSRTVEIAQDCSSKCLKIPPHSASLDSSFSKWRLSKSQEFGSTTGGPPLGDLIFCQHRRGSVPVELSLQFLKGHD